MATKLKHNRVTPNVKAACEDCRRRKTKCDGARPVCSQCAKRSRICEYDAEPDEYRTATLKRKCKMFEQQAMESQQLLFALRDSPEVVAVELLRRLRAGENVPTILGSIPQSQAQENEQRVRSPSFAESSHSTGGGIADTAPSQLLVRDRLEQPVPPEPQHFTVPDRSRLAIGFLVNDPDQAGTGAMQQPSIDANDRTARTSPHFSRLSSYPPITPTSMEQYRRLSAPLSQDATAETTMKEAIRVAHASNDWDKYYTNVSTLFRSLGEPPPGTRP